MAETNQRHFSIQLYALLLGLVLMGAKFIAWWLTNSNAILTDALESIINVVAAAFGLYSLALAAKPRDRNHPYGHGKVEFLSAGFEGTLIFLAGLAIIGKAGYNLVYPQIIHDLDIGLLLAAGAGAINYGIGYFLEKRGKRHKSLILQASGKHLKSDAYSSAGLVIGLILVIATGITALDSLVALIFGGIIIWTGFRLVRQSVAGIMDEADYILIKELVDKLQQDRMDSWIDIHNFRVIKYGATLHIDCHMTVPWYYDIRQGHEEARKFEIIVKELCEAPVEFFIHLDPCEPPGNCRICSVEGCQKRKAPLEATVTWTLDNIMRDQKHDA
ncbi:MAG: cation transporter [Lewinellaceae bacterium]|nr:cation transporter [Lewinellaceae bacterium]